MACVVRLLSRLRAPRGIVVTLTQVSVLVGELFDLNFRKWG